MIRNGASQRLSEDAYTAQVKEESEGRFEQFDVENRQDIVRILNVLQGFGEKEIEVARRRKETVGVDYRRGWLDEITELRAFMGTGGLVPVPICQTT